MVSTISYRYTFHLEIRKEEFLVWFKHFMELFIFWINLKPAKQKLPLARSPCSLLQNSGAGLSAEGILLVHMCVCVCVCVRACVCVFMWDLRGAQWVVEASK